MSDFKIRPPPHLPSTSVVACTSQLYIAIAIRGHTSSAWNALLHISLVFDISLPWYDLPLSVCEG